ncbi:MAG: hypothetical protein FJX76_18840 [Armatimonadetes bacterium]|nr:hypothetical protein [Armatimonadota bacterium]
MDDWLLPYVGTNVGLGLVSGWAVGFTLKKIAKLAAILLGISFVLIQILVVNKFLAINWPGLAAAFAQISKKSTAQSPHWWSLLLYNFPYAGSFAVGFFLGFKKG